MCCCSLYQSVIHAKSNCQPSCNDVCENLSVEKAPDSLFQLRTKGFHRYGLNQIDLILCFLKLTIIYNLTAFNSGEV